MVTAVASSSLFPPLHLSNLLFMQTSPVISDLSFHTCPPAVTIEDLASAHCLTLSSSYPASPHLCSASAYIERTAISHFLPGYLSTHLSAFWIPSGFIWWPVKPIKCGILLPENIKSLCYLHLFSSFDITKKEKYNFVIALVLHSLYQAGTFINLL